MVHEDLRSVTGSLQRREQSLAEVVDDGIGGPILPGKLFHSRHLMVISNLIQSILSEIRDQSVEGIWEEE
jgi:hypothetical protein